jgi:hypothetical protein
VVIAYAEALCLVLPLMFFAGTRISCFAGLMVVLFVPAVLAAVGNI